jgi:hypothetical protein
MGVGLGIMIILDKLVLNVCNWVVMSHDYSVLYEPSPEGTRISWQ